MRDLHLVEQLAHPVSHFRNRAQCRPGRFAMPRQIEREHPTPVMGQIPRLQAPYRAVHAGAVEHHHDRQSLVERPSAGCGKGGVLVEFEYHRSDAVVGGTLRLSTFPRRCLRGSVITGYLASLQKGLCSKAPRLVLPSILAAFGLIAAKDAIAQDALKLTFDWPDALKAKVVLNVTVVTARDDERHTAGFVVSYKLGAAPAADGISITTQRLFYRTQNCDGDGSPESFRWDSCLRQLMPTGHEVFIGQYL